MIHDTMISKTGERREDSRVEMAAELVVRWFDDPGPVRYAMIDRSDGGYRISSSVPVLSGAMGTALRLLPTGTRLDHAVMVAWAREVDGRWELGLRRL